MLFLMRPIRGRIQALLGVVPPPNRTYIARTIAGLVESSGIHEIGPARVGPSLPASRESLPDPSRASMRARLPLRCRPGTSWPGRVKYDFSMWFARGPRLAPDPGKRASASLKPSGERISAQDAQGRPPERP